ncbi:MAG TPA: GNAT family N-acetyltransferase [Nitrospira sp.]|nr:GNAT family N-acetyltransferase [Nitrospira sp.]MBX7041108.1 GNAT family N-acetyltransferase [Nitrospira sp.]MCW5792856.1 GNAT family N-acetyltransferase [Nitrospira sp.]HMU29754.1 GNAT family N-acetyltransferase [Nitrospira sp.]HMV58375.1 GNAT family N-acetyltransferase [Nitrospira sp.]
MISADQLRIRLATVQDVDVLTTFSAAMAWETEHRRLDLARLRLGTQAVIDRPEQGQYYVADLHRNAPADTVTVGQLLLTYEWSDWRNAQFWWIQSVYVDPAWRRQGVYRAMHQAVMALAQSRADVCGVRLYVEGDNTVAQGVYERVGLTPSTYRIYESDFVLPKPSSPDRR